MSQSGGEGRGWRQTWHQAVDQVFKRAWRRDGKRAEHMPLLLLLLISRAERRAPPSMTYLEVEAQLDPLLRAFGPKNKTSPHYPFWYLRNNEAGIWTIPSASELELGANRKPLLSKFRLRNPSGEVPAPLWEELCRSECLRRDLVSRVLEEFWPSTLHADILAELRMAPSGRRMVTREIAVRDAGFGREVVQAYGCSCAICGFDARLGDRRFGVDAAHIKWHSRGGTDSVDNGLALCNIHHKAYDEGALGVGLDLQVKVSPALTGGLAVQKFLECFRDREVLVPELFRPADHNLEWHLREVFRD